MPTDSSPLARVVASLRRFAPHIVCHKRHEDVAGASFSSPVGETPFKKMCGKSQTVGSWSSFPARFGINTRYHKDFRAPVGTEDWGGIVDALRLLSDRIQTWPLGVF